MIESYFKLQPHMAIVNEKSLLTHIYIILHIKKNKNSFLHFVLYVLRKQFSQFSGIWSLMRCSLFDSEFKPTL